MTDPLDVLRSESTPAEPDPAFRALLMAEVRSSLAGRAPMADLPDDPTPMTPLEITMNDHAAPRSNLRRLAVFSAAAAVIVGLVLLATLRDDPEPESPEATVATSAVTTTGTSPVTDPMSDAAIAQAALLGSDEVGGGYLPGLGETFLNSVKLGVDLPECATFKDTVFTPINNATRTVQILAKQLGAQFEQATWVFPTVEEATGVIDGITATEYAPCDVAVNIAAVDAASCCEQADLTASDPPTITPAGDQQVVRSVSGTFVAGGKSASVENTIVYTRVGRVIIVFGIPGGLDAPGGPGGPDATIEEMVAASIAHLDGTPIR